MRIPQRMIKPFNVVGITDLKRLYDMVKQFSPEMSKSQIEINLHKSFDGLVTTPPQDIRLIMPIMECLAEGLGCTDVDSTLLGANAFVMDYKIGRVEDKQLFIFDPEDIPK